MTSHFYFLPLALFLLLSPTVHSGDVRCKCVCKSDVDRQIFIATSVDFEDCKCDNVVPETWMKSCAANKCECSYDIRNTNVLRVSVVLTIVSISAMALFVLGDKIIWNFVRMPRKVYEWKQTNLDKRNRVYVNRSMLS
eukprot:sb/3474424/